MIDRFEVRSGERLTSDTVGVERAELGSQTAQPFGTDIWVAYAMKVTAAPLTSDWLVAGQFRATDDAGDFASRSPVWSVLLYPDDVLVIATRSDPTDPSVGQPDFVNRYAGTFERGVWMQFVHRVRFAKTGDGLIQSWIDCTEVIAETAVPVGYNDVLGPKWRYGIYREADAATTVIEYTNMECGTASLLDRVTDPLPLP